jgi:hypothetical protein
VKRKSIPSGTALMERFPNRFACYLTGFHSFSTSI